MSAEGLGEAGVRRVADLFGDRSHGIVRADQQACRVLHSAPPHVACQRFAYCGLKQSLQVTLRETERRR